MILKLKRTPGIFLVGFMGSGKTTLGRLLANEIGWPFIDIDEEIEASAGCSINEIFDTRGEAEFRKLESEAIASRVCLIERGNPSVVTLGGGAFVQQANYELVSANGISVWLDCPLDLLWRRVSKDSTSPLARDRERFARLYESRRPAYSRADYRVVITTDDPATGLRLLLDLPVF